MTQNNDEQKKKPWEASFTEETSPDESAAPSRTQFRKRSSRTAWIVSLLILAVVVLASYPVVRYVESINSPGSSADEPAQTQISTSVPSKSSAKKSNDAAKDSQSKADASSEAAASSQAAASSAAVASSQAAVSTAAASRQAAQQAAAQQSSMKAAQEQAAQQSSSSSSTDSSSSSSQDGGQYDTVKVNGYRLALAHGLSLGELQALNPGVDLNNVHVGESLRVK